MIEVLRRYGPIKLREKWFTSRVMILDVFSLVHYVQCNEVSFRFGFYKTSYPTKIVDLGRPSNLIQSDFDKAAIYEIRRAERDGVEMLLSTDVVGFISFYNIFAKNKGLTTLSVKQLEPLKSFLSITHAVHNGSILVMHAYVLEPNFKRCRLLYSASHFRDITDTSLRAQVGRANRFLHWASIIHFREIGFLEYDFGGYALNTNNPILRGINQFKDSFGGTIRVESNYSSWLLILMQRVRALFKKMML